jgi:pentapeptide MXKDX repeat protein
LTAAIRASQRPKADLSLVRSCNLEEGTTVDMKRQVITMMIAGGFLAAGAPGWAQEAKQDNMSQDKMSSDKMSSDKMSGDNMPQDKTSDNGKMKHKKSKKKADKMKETKDKMKGM